MHRLLKHITTFALCLLIIFGAVGTHVYIFTCSQHHHAALLGLSEDAHHCCCEHADHHDHHHDAECAHHDDTSCLSQENACCHTTSEVLSVSNFEVSKISQLNKIAVLTLLFDFLQNGCCELCNPLAQLAFATSVHSPHEPDILQYGQLRL